MNLNTIPGPGDEITWGPVTGHPNDPRQEDDGEFHNEQTALDAATEDVLATPYTWAWFLNETVDGVNPVPTHKRFDDMTDLSNGELLALIMDCFDATTVMLARAELRDRFLAHADTQQSLLDRAAELVGEPL
jgi:hypothetical protein